MDMQAQLDAMKLSMVSARLAAMSAELLSLKQSMLASNAKEYKEIEQAESLLRSATMSLGVKAELLKNPI